MAYLLDGTEWNPQAKATNICDTPNPTTYRLNKPRLLLVIGRTLFNFPSNLFFQIYVARFIEVRTESLHVIPNPWRDIIQQKDV